MSELRDDARATVGQLITLARRGELEMVAGSLGMLSFTRPAHQERLRRILLTLIEATAEMLRAKANRLGATGGVGLNLRRFTDDSPVDIDEIDPPVRAAIRALLAAVNHSPTDTADQVDLVMAGGHQGWRDAMLVAMEWAISAIEWCERYRVTTPPWL